MQGKYHHEYDREEIKGDVDYLFDYHHRYVIRDFALWFRKLGRNYRRAFTIGDLFLNPYWRARRRGRYLSHIIKHGDNVKRNWFVGTSKSEFISLKYFGTRYNVEIDMPFVF